MFRPASSNVLGTDMNRKHLQVVFKLSSKDNFDSRMLLKYLNDDEVYLASGWRILDMEKETDKNPVCSLCFFSKFKEIGTLHFVFRNSERI